MAELTIQQTFELALRHHQAGRLREAEELYRQILARQPDYVDAMHPLGAIAHQAGRNEIAIDLIRRAVALRPGVAQGHYNLGVVLQSMGRADEAVAAFGKAIAINPNYADAHNNLGTVLGDVGKLDEAIVACRRAIALKPGFPEAYNNLGSALTHREQFEEAIIPIRRAIELRPNYAKAYYNLGVALQCIGRLDEAIAAYQQAISLNFNLPKAHNNLGNILKDKGQLDDAIAAYRQAVAVDPDNAFNDSNLVFVLPFHPGYDAQAIAEENRRWNGRHAEPVGKFIQRHTNDRDPDRKLRIGYVSPDFRDHCQSFFTIPLLSNHDRGSFENFCYADVRRPDAMTTRIRELTDQWRPIKGTTDEAAAGKIREDKIDILVDLTMHMANGRPLIFARKPAPVQTAWLAYPGTTGMSAMDYRLTDPQLDPPGANDQFYSEMSIRLPHSFWCYDPLTPEPGVSSLPAESVGWITFGSLNNFCKVNEQVVRLWAQVLKAVEGSRMMILCPEGSHRGRLFDVLQSEGIHPDRIELVTQRPRLQYLEVYHRIDLGLDSFPSNGHTTSLDSFWMGVPVITLVGKTVVGRAGLSQLTNLGLTELVAYSPEEYVRIAAELAGDLPRLAELRRTLRARMQASPLMDAAGFTRGIESAYRQMWRTWCAGQSA